MPAFLTEISQNLPNKKYFSQERDNQSRSTWHKILTWHLFYYQNDKQQKGIGWKQKDAEIREPLYHFWADLKRRSALCKHLVHQLDSMHQRAQGHTGTGWRLPLTATVNFQHNQFMCSSIITICVLHEEDSPEEENSAGCCSPPWAAAGSKKEKRESGEVENGEKSWGERHQGWRSTEVNLSENGKKKWEKGIIGDHEEREGHNRKIKEVREKRERWWNLLTFGNTVGDEDISIAEVKKVEKTRKKYLFLVAFHYWMQICWMNWVNSIFPCYEFGFSTRLAPLALETHRILIHLRCQNLPGWVSLRRLLNHLREPITLCAVKANSK